MRTHVDIEIRLVVVLIAWLESDSNGALGRDMNERRDVEVMRPASDLAGVVNRASERIEYRRTICEPLRQLLELRSLACVEGVAHCDRVAWNLVVSLECIPRGIDAQGCDLRANPLSGLDDSAAMQPIPRNWLIFFRDNQQRKIGWPDTDAECSSGGDYPGEQSRESRHPFQICVTVVGSVVQERDSGGGAELYRVVQL